MFIGGFMQGVLCFLIKIEHRMISKFKIPFLVLSKFPICTYSIKINYIVVSGKYKQNKFVTLNNNMQTFITLL